MNVIILAAGRNTRLKEHLSKYYNDCHKCLIPINGVPLIHRMIHIFKSIQPNNIIIVVGANKESIIDSINSNGFVDDQITILENEKYTEGSMLSLAQALDYFDDDIIYIDADMYFDPGFVYKLVESPKENCLLLDLKVEPDDVEAYCAAYDHDELIEVGRDLKGAHDVMGEWTGITKLSKPAARRLREILLENIRKGNTHLGYEPLTLVLSKEYPVEYELVDPHRWIEIDTKEDLFRAKSIFEK
jgi:choline kinase